MGMMMFMCFHNMQYFYLQMYNPANIAESLSRSFLQDENILLLHTPCLCLGAAIAIALYRPTHHLTLLVDFSGAEEMYINSVLHVRHQEHLLMHANVGGKCPSVCSSFSKKEQRVKMYLEGGIYAVTSMVLLLDLLEGRYPAVKTKIIVRQLRKVEGQYSRMVWMLGLIKKISTVQVVVTSDRIVEYEGAQLESMFRWFYMDRVVVWPFGRQEIRTALSNHKVHELSHKLTLTPQEQELHSHLLKLYKITQSETNQRQGQLRKLRELLSCVFNCTKLEFLHRLMETIQMSLEFQVWKSNSPTRIALVQDIKRCGKNGVYSLERLEGNFREVDLSKFLQNDKNEQNKESKVSKEVKQSKQTKQTKDTKETKDNERMQSIEEKEKKDMNANLQELDIQGRQNEKIKYEKAQQKQQEKGEQKQEEKIINPYVVEYQLHLYQEPEKCIPAKLAHLINILKTSSSTSEQISTTSYPNLYFHTNYISHKHTLLRHLNNFNLGTEYTTFLYMLFKYLENTRENRLKIISKIIQRSNPNKHKHTEMFMEEQETVLLEELYAQIKSVIQLVDGYHFISDLSQRRELWKKEVQRFVGKYVEMERISLNSLDTSIKDDLILHGKYRVVIQTDIDLSVITQKMSLLYPPICVFYDPNPALIRHLYIINAENQLNIEQMHTLTFKDSFEVERVSEQIVKEDRAFWNITQERKKLGKFNENPDARIKTLEINDEISSKAKAIHSMQKIDIDSNSIKEISIKVQRVVLVDKRQFRSNLPSYLYHFGFKVIPVFLKIGDYILSDSVVIEKKSVHTKDLHISLKNRLHKQIEKMCKYKNPYLLIECQDSSYFSRENFRENVNHVTGQKYHLNVRRQIIQLMKFFPKLRIIWSTSLLNTVQIFKELKKNQRQPDLSKFKTIIGEDSDSPPSDSDPQS